MLNMRGTLKLLTDLFFLYAVQVFLYSAGTVKQPHTDDVVILMYHRSESLQPV